MAQRGAGDRWLAGEQVDGVRFAFHQSVQVTAGASAGAFGTVALLIALTPEPLYLVELGGGAGNVRVPQSALRAAA